METVRIHIKVSTTGPVAESLGGLFEVKGSGCVDVYRVIRDRIREMAPAEPDTDPDIDSGG